MLNESHHKPVIIALIDKYMKEQRYIGHDVSWLSRVTLDGYLHREM